MSTFAGIQFESEPINILFEDEWILAVSKPSGLMVHANPESKVEQGPNLQDLLSAGRKRQLTLFHRLDKDTSGLVLLGKRPEISAAMTRLFEEKKIRKAYFAVVEGEWKKSVNRIENYLARAAEGRMAIVDEGQGQRALTTFRVLDSSSAKTWLEVMPKTGRTHQIRVHCASAGHPVLGDRLYGQVSEVGRLALHAHQLNFTHPLTKENIQLNDSPPRAWRETWLSGFKTERT